MQAAESSSLQCNWYHLFNSTDCLVNPGFTAMFQEINKAITEVEVETDWKQVLEDMSTSEVPLIPLVGVVLLLVPWLPLKLS